MKEKPEQEASGQEPSTEAQPAKRPRSRDTYHAGFVSILGLPNAGKSTLLNALLGTKVAIVTPKPQTTRTTIQGVMHMPRAQVVFLDTPGIHKSDTLINRRMMESVRSAAHDRDLLLFVADATRAPGEAEKQAIDLVKSAGTPAFLILNKIDRLATKESLFDRIGQYKAIHEFAEFIPVSALKSKGLDDLKRTIAKYLPKGKPIFPEDYLTDQPERFLASELVREKILRVTNQEVPHSAAVLVETWEETSTLVRIGAAIYVERSGQKIIIVGKGGEGIKRIGTQARKEIETLLDKKVHLDLFVKVKENWREDPRFLNEIDWRGIIAG